jgi:hypothetical protein
MISAPIVNAGLKSLPKQRLLYTMLVFIACAVYMRGDYFSYTYLNALVFYCLGYTLRTLNIASYFSKRVLLLLYFLICLVAAGVSYFCAPYSETFFFRYTNIFTLTSAVVLYLYFSKLEFRSQVVNNIATAALGCYLLQDGRFGQYYLYDFQHSFFLSHGYGFALLTMLAASFIGFWVVSFLLTKFNGLWIGRVSEFIVLIVEKVTAPLRYRLQEYVFHCVPSESEQ